jgi:hypothetical protein
MRDLACIILGASIAALLLGALGINRSLTPDGTYLAAILGVAGICGLAISAFVALQ